MISAGTGPFTENPSLASCRTAGAIRRRSSLPSAPPSPACGLSPATPTVFLPRPSHSRAWAARRPASRMEARVRWRGTSDRGKWRVTSSTRSPPPMSIMAKRRVRVSSASISVWPGALMPAFLSPSLQMGAVTMPSRVPESDNSTARRIHVQAARDASARMAPGRRRGCDVSGQITAWEPRGHNSPG